MAEGMAGFRLGCIAKQTADVRIAFDIGSPCKLQVAAVGLRFTGKSPLQVFVAFSSLQTLAHQKPPVEIALVFEGL
jgi:hypothetical protein